jgi:hypothetical protein
MTGEKTQTRPEIYDSMNRSAIPYDRKDRGEFDDKRLNRINIAEALGCKPSLARQLAAYVTQVLIRRLQGNPDLEGEAFLKSPFYEQAREQAEREEGIR